MNIKNIDEDFLILSDKLQNDIYYNEISNKISISNINENTKLMLTKFFYILKSKNFDEFKKIINHDDDEKKQIQILTIKIMIVKIMSLTIDDKNIKLNDALSNIKILIQKINSRNIIEVTSKDNNKLIILYNLKNQINTLLNISS